MKTEGSIILTECYYYTQDVLKKMIELFHSDEFISYRKNTKDNVQSKYGDVLNESITTIELSKESYLIKLTYCISDLDDYPLEFYFECEDFNDFINDLTILNFNVEFIDLLINRQNMYRNRYCNELD